VPARLAKHSAVAIMGDIVRSRKMTPRVRSKLQQQFETFVAKINRKYADALLSNFSIASGDEFQGLLRTAKEIPELLWDLEEMLPDHELRTGFGRGAIYTQLREDPNKIDGPAFHLAREAINFAAKTNKLGGVFLGFNDLDSVLNSMTGILWFHRKRWTDQQRKVVSMIRAGKTQSEISGRLHVTRQAVSKHVSASGALPYLDTERAVGYLLERYVDGGHK
jgi:SatD family (SatD)